MLIIYTIKLYKMFNYYHIYILIILHILLYIIRVVSVLLDIEGLKSQSVQVLIRYFKSYQLSNVSSAYPKEVEGIVYEQMSFLYFIYTRKCIYM